MSINLFIILYFLRIRRCEMRCSRNRRLSCWFCQHLVILIHFKFLSFVPIFFVDASRECVFYSYFKLLSTVCWSNFAITFNYLVSWEKWSLDLFDYLSAVCFFATSHVDAYISQSNCCVFLALYCLIFFFFFFTFLNLNQNFGTESHICSARQ